MFTSVTVEQHRDIMKRDTIFVIPFISFAFRVLSGSVWGGSI